MRYNTNQIFTINIDCDAVDPDEAVENFCDLISNKITLMVMELEKTQDITLDSTQLQCNLIEEN